ncbi:hypothetical protein [Carnobacterium maltaromaticum]|uniref:hypothetical protein n=1 Tax=Carnobacterium maltaromaticum TaxID=2751 RepID=UPI00295E8538|nr:hypothetical protein [Carnobacterium maltaromaticum]
MKKIFCVLLCVFTLMCFPKEVYGVESVEITISGNVATAKLIGKPDSYAVQSKIYDTLINQKNVKKLIVDGEFGKDNASARARQLCYTNISELEVKNSNYLPSQFYLAGANSQPGKLTSYKDDGSVKVLMQDSLSMYSNFRDLNRLIYFESPSAEKINRGVFDGFRGEELIVPQIKESVGKTSSNYNNFEQMPNVKKINLSGLKELTGFGLFTDMPNLTSLDLGNVKNIDSMYFLNNNNSSPTYVDLSSLIMLDEKYSVGSETSINPVYIKLGINPPEKLFNENTNAIFYQSISPVLNLEVEKGNAINVSSIGESSFLSYNTNDCKIIWYIDNTISKYVGTDINVETGNLSEGVHSFTPVILYKGKEDRGFFGDLNINVDIYKKKLTADPVFQTTSLGTDVSKLDYSKFVTKVKLGGQLLSSYQYKVELINSLSADTIGIKNAKIRVTLDSDTSKTADLDVPVEVGWGKTIGSNNVIYSTSTGFSLSLLPEDKPNIVATLGNGGNSSNWINDYKNETYITTKIYRDSQLLNSENTSPYINLAISGRDSAKTATDKWNSISNKNAISYGDVLQYDVFTIWGDNKWVMRDEVQKFESLGKQSIYYEITKSGYRTLHLNHLETKNVTIPIYSTEEYLDEHIRDYIDLKRYSNISVKEFSQYPNTKVSGQEKGKIIVEETLTTGKKVQYEYEVTFTIGDGTLTYSVPKTLAFKEFSKSKSEQVIQRMYSGDLGLKISDNRGQGKQGNWRLTAQVMKSEELSPYFIFRDGISQDKYLNQGATEIYSQSKQSNPIEPLDVEVSGQWKKDTGILLKVPPKNNLSSKQYTTTITWNLVEEP